MKNVVLCAIYDFLSLQLGVHNRSWNNTLFSVSFLTGEKNSANKKCKLIKHIITPTAISDLRQLFYFLLFES